MKKMILDFGKVSSGMRISVHLVLESGDPKDRRKLINRFTFNGSEYIKLTPFPYINIDISKAFDKTDEWSTNRSLTLNALNQIKLMYRLRSIIENLSTKDLFYYDNANKLIVNKELSEQSKSPFSLGAKTCIMQYAVVPDENGHFVHEGVIFMINSVDNFCYLNIEELHLLLYRLESINLSHISMNMMQIYTNMENSNNNGVENSSMMKPVQDIITENKPTNDINSNIVKPYVINDDGVPDII